MKEVCVQLFQNQYLSGLVRRVGHFELEEMLYVASGKGDVTTIRFFFFFSCAAAG
jgi:hypothetical protein